MKSTSLTVLLAALGLATPLFAQNAPDLKDPQQRLSYAIGTQMGSSMRSQGVEVDPKALAAGLSDALAGKPGMTDAEIKDVMTAFRDQMMAKMQAKQAVDGEKNVKASEEFLAANAKKDGVKATASGLQYKVIKSGTGKSPGPKDTVKVHYHGTLPDGTVFDSSVDRKEPVTFPVDGVIPGWTEALQLMKEGDKWQIVIPAKLAYGEQGAPPKIGPNTALVFDVELLSIEK
jgi:FKBP-type peptidyl-prolyl cis-trans isomerase